MFKGAILALDLASVTGWAYGKPDAVPTFGHKRFVNPGGSRAAAYRTFRLWLDLFCSSHKTDLIVFESPLAALLHGTTNISTLKVLTGLAEHLEEWAYERIELREANVAQVRAHFIGGNFKSKIAKAATVERCRVRGWGVETSDEADAVALWDYQRCCLRPDIGTRTTPLFAKAHDH